MGYSTRKRPLPLTDSEDSSNHSSHSSTRYPKRVRRSTTTSESLTLKSEDTNDKILSDVGYADTLRAPLTVRLLLLPEARAALSNRKSSKSMLDAFRVTDKSFTIFEYFPSRIKLTLPRGHSYALVNGNLVQIRLTGEEGVLFTATKSLGVGSSEHTRRTALGKKVKSTGLSLAAENELSGQYLLSQFKEKSAAIKSRKEFRPQSPAPTDAAQSGGAEKCPIKTLSQEEEEFRSALLELDALPISPYQGCLEATPTRLFEESINQSSKKVQKVEQLSPKTSPPQSVQAALDSTPLDSTRASPLPHSLPRIVDPSTSKSVKLTAFANRLASLTTALYKATEVLPQMALEDLEGVLENDWMVEDMEKMVMGVISYVNGRGEEGERQWRSGGGSGKL